MIATVLLAGCSGHPQRVHVLGRNYDRGNDGPLSLGAVHNHFGPSAVILSHGKRIAGTTGPYAPTVIFIKDGHRYYEYALSGGP